MSGKQMEGDNQRRRARARRAREEGRAPGEAGVTLGASKQREHEEHAHRTGPPPAGTHKPVPHDRDEGGPARPAPEWPRSPDRLVGAEPDTADGIRYHDLVADVSRRVGISFDQARLACEATVAVLARVLPGSDRERFLGSLPGELHDDDVVLAHSPADLTGFLDEVAAIVHRPLEQARYRAQAAVSALWERDRELVESLAWPHYLDDLKVTPPAGGGIVAPTGGVPPLTPDELTAALATLPRWAGSRRSLVRTIALPPENLERVLRRLAGLKRELGRGPHIARDDEGTATLVLRTNSVDAVTTLDVQLAHRVDAAIDEAGAGMNAG